MKYILYWELRLEDFDKMAEKVMKYNQIIKENPEKWGKIILTPHATSTDYCKGFFIAESEQDQIADLIAYFFPEMKMTYEPLFNTGKQMELILKRKK